MRIDRRQRATQTDHSTASPSARESVKRKILIADDQADERAIQRALLHHLGYDVIEAADGEMTLELAGRTRPDLVLLDIAMPKVDGLEVARALKADPRTAHVRVLFLTASPAGEVEQKVQEAGGDAVLMKPVDPNVVAAEVERLIGPASSPG